MSAQPDSPHRRMRWPAWLLAALVGPAAAMEPDFSLSGFGTAGFSCFSSSTAQYVADYLQPSGPGRDQRCSTELDSMLGVQLSGTLIEDLDFDLQAVSKLTAHGDYDPAVALALLNWHPNEELTVRLGRTSNPNFLYSEARNVRFVMPWVRPPVALYSLSPVLHYDGIDVLYNTELAAWSAELHLGAARSKEDFLVTQTRDITASRARMVHANLTLQQAAWTMKFGYTQGEYSATPPSFEQLLNTVIAPFDAGLAADLKVDHSGYRLLSASAAYHGDEWFVLGEVGIDDIDSLIVLDSIAAYVTVGRELGAWTPYATLAKRWNRRKDDQRGDALPIAGLVRSILDSRANELQSLSLGVSHALHENVVLKVQLDWIRPSSGSSGGYANLAPTTDLGNPGDEALFSINLDFVF